MTSTISEIEILDALDFDLEDEDLCTSKYGCDRKAVWALHMMCCGYIDRFCVEHKRNLDEWLTTRSLRSEFSCLSCRTTWSGRDPYAMLRWEKL